MAEVQLIVFENNVFENNERFFKMPLFDSLNLTNLFLEENYPIFPIDLHSTLQNVEWKISS